MAVKQQDYLARFWTDKGVNNSLFYQRKCVKKVDYVLKTDKKCIPENRTLPMLFAITTNTTRTLIYVSIKSLNQTKLYFSIIVIIMHL